MAGFSDLPEELVFKILVLLPVDSLLCSKCVQKSWYSLITNSRFVVKHLRNQIRNKNSCALVISRPISFDISEANGLFFHFCDCNHIFTVELFWLTQLLENSDTSVNTVTTLFATGWVVLALVTMSNPMITKLYEYCVFRMALVEVYTLSADCWRELAANIDFLGAGTRFLKDNFECQYFRGACYWISWNKSVGINYNNLV
ncbi:hypothetical protein CUMW_279430 [Citrus unshiu]|uniref:F-box domain-containing protein n=1 Tax=Citrus unshiu TaxID=55188 RepID=A0A2H5N7J2_CITUN|nr:hypothetical protein CUMW_279430 [Citrus unshiu]